MIPVPLIVPFEDTLELSVAYNGYYAEVTIENVSVRSDNINDFLELADAAQRAVALLRASDSG